MKKLFSLLIMIILITGIQAQTTSKSIPHGGLTRTYIEHVPNIYNPSTPVPVLICLHGLGDNMTNFTGIGMHQLANTQNFIVLTPQAVNSPMGAAWNSGASYMGYQINATIDDIGFIGKLIDTTMSLYNVDPTRIYAMGFSMGGFMCNKLACELNNRIAAIASVAGTIGASLTCNPGRAVPVMHLHGSGDQTIPYTANQYGLDAMQMVMFWVHNNNCDTIPIETDVPDVAQDGFTIKHLVFENGDDNTKVEHYRVDSADHQWIYPPNNDMSYTLAIWQFVSQFTLPSWININEKTKSNDISFFPNPASDYLKINNNDNNFNKIEIIDIFGHQVLCKENHILSSPIYINNLKSGMYILKVFDYNNNLKTFKFTKL